MFAFGFRDTRAALDSPMMRLGDRSAPLFVRAGGQPRHHATTGWGATTGHHKRRSGWHPGGVSRFRNRRGGSATQSLDESREHVVAIDRYLALMAGIERLADKARTMEIRDHEIPTVRFAGSVPAIAWKYSVLLKSGDGIDPVRRITAREGFTVVRSRFSREHWSVPRA